MTVNKLTLTGAINGKAENQYLLGRKYYYDEDERNYALAAEWFGEAAANGHLSAMFMYGYMLLNGSAGKVDVKKGTKMVKRSARGGNISALLLLARNYYYGYGVKKDDKKAFSLWEKGAEMGCPEAEYYLGLCFAKGICAKKNNLKAKKHLYNALELGYRPAEIAIKDYRLTA